MINKLLIIYEYLYKSNPGEIHLLQDRLKETLQIHN